MSTVGEGSLFPSCSASKSHVHSAFPYDEPAEAKHHHPAGKHTSAALWSILRVQVGLEEQEPLDPDA